LGLSGGHKAIRKITMPIEIRMGCQYAQNVKNNITPIIKYKGRLSKKPIIHNDNIKYAE